MNLCISFGLELKALLFYKTHILMKKSLLLVHLILCILSITSFVAEAQIPSYVPSNGLVGWWPFNGNANDESGNGNNGTVNGATLTTDRFGNAGKAYSFNGAILNTIAINLNPVVDSIFTLNIWAKCSRTINLLPVSSSCPIGVNVNMANSNQNWVIQPLQMGNPNLGCGGLSMGTNGIMTAEHGINILTNRHSYGATISGYKMVTVIYRLDSTFLLVDGVVVDAKPIHCPSSLKRIYGFSLGGSLYSPNFAGDIDDIGIWNRALTQQEITALYNAQPCTPQIVYIHDTLYQAPPCLPNYVPTNGLLGWWPFCGNANDESGNGNNGTVNGATLTSDRFGNAGKAYSFDGVNDYVAATLNGMTNQNSSFSVSIWFNRNNSSSIVRYMFGFGNPMMFGEMFGFGDYGSQGIFGTFLGSQYDVITGLDTGNYNVWKNLVVVYNTPGILKFYLNGSFLFTGSALSNPNIQLGNCKIGMRPGNTNEFWSGSLDDIGIWNRALTQQEITALYTGSPCTQMITLYDTIHTYDTITTLVHTYDTIPVYDTIHIAVTDTLVINANLTGVNPPNNYNTVKVYPNPAKDYLILNFGPNWSSMSGYQVTITNITGQQVYNGNVINQVINLSLNSWGGYGTYTLTIRDTQGNVKEVKKIVLQ